MWLKRKRDIYSVIVVMCKSSVVEVSSDQLCDIITHVKEVLNGKTPKRNQTK